MNALMKEKIERQRKAIYRVVKAMRPDLYESAVQVGHMALPLFHPNGTSEEAIAAEVESCAMLLVARALEIEP